MENEITYNEKFDIIESTTKIVYLKNQTAQNIIEIGKELIKVKNNLAHGEFLNYLESKVDFSHKTATKFMKISNEYSNMNSLSHLNSTKLFALLDVPAEEREEFVINNDIENKSVRETARLIEEAKIKDDYIDKLVNELNNQKPVVKEVIKEVVPESHQRMLQNMKTSLANSEKEFLVLQKRIKELEPLENKKESIEKAYKELNELDKRNSQIRSEIEDSSKLLAFLKDFDNYYHNKMMPVATVFNIKSLHDNFKEEFKTRILNIENWLFAIKQKYQL